MNAAARALAQGSLASSNVKAVFLSRYHVGLLSLMLAILVTALGVIYVKDLERRLFSELQMLQQARDTFQVEWGQLLLEQNTWATQARIQSIAQQRLAMIVPSTPTVTLIAK